MKKLIVLLIVVLLGIALVGCGNEWKSWSDVFPEEQTQYYTQEEVDELIQSAINELGEEIENDIPQQYYSKDEIDQLIQDQIDELELIIDNLEEIIFENQRRLDDGYNIPTDIEIMYGEMTGVEASMDGDPNNNYVLVTVKGVEYKTFHISDEPVYWYSKMIVIRIGNVYLSYVNKNE